MVEWKWASITVSAVAIDLSIHDVRHVAALAEELLHNLLARPSQLRPVGFGFRVLFKSSNFAPVVREIHLSQTTLGSSANMVSE